MSQKQNLFKSVIANIITIVVVLFVGFVIGFKVNNTVPDQNIFTKAPNEVDLDTFWQVWDVLETKYPFEDKEPNTEDKVYGAIRGLASSYKDPHTIFLEPKEAKIFNEDVGGAFSGVGMEVGARDGFLVVVAPLKDSPAENAGVRAGDIILKINGDASAEMYLDEAVQHIRGKKGTDVVLNVARKDVLEPIDINITRDTIIVPTVDTEMINDDIFKINLYTFSANATRDFTKAIKEFSESDTEKIIIDLRNNPGGFLEASVDIASYFIPQDKIVLIEDFGGTEDEITYRSKGFPTLAGKDFDMVILVDGGSASASEILAGALSEHNIATLVGEKLLEKVQCKSL